MLVVGIPNVGKSTIINALRVMTGKGKVAKTGASPGVTRSMSGFSVFFYLDSAFFLFFGSCFVFVLFFVFRFSLLVFSF